jgi:hypothetical protein
MLFPIGLSDYAIALNFIHVSKNVKEFLGEINPTISSTSLSVVRTHEMIRRNSIMFLEMEDYLENRNGHQTKVRLIFWKENPDEEPSAVILLSEDIDTRKEFYQNLKTFMETSNC